MKPCPQAGASRRLGQDVPVSVVDQHVELLFLGNNLETLEARQPGCIKVRKVSKEHWELVQNNTFVTWLTHYNAGQ